MVNYTVQLSCALSTHNKHDDDNDDASMTAVSAT